MFPGNKSGYECTFIQRGLSGQYGGLSGQSEVSDRTLSPPYHLLATFDLQMFNCFDQAHDEITLAERFSQNLARNNLR